MAVSSVEEDAKGSVLAGVARLARYGSILGCLRGDSVAHR